MGDKSTSERFVSCWASDQAIIYFNKASRCSGTQGLLGTYLVIIVEKYCFQRKANSNSLHFQFYSYPYRYWHSVGGATGSSLPIAQCSEQIAHRREYCFERKANMSNSRWWFVCSGLSVSSPILSCYTLSSLVSRLCYCFPILYYS